MRVTRIYQACRLHLGDVLALNPQASHHLLNVLRIKSGADLIVFNGRGGEFLAECVAIEKRKVIVKLKDFIDISVESPLDITLLHGVAKGDRMDWVVQKSVELGVNNIVPLLTDRCNVKLNKERWQKKQQHWQAIAERACEQCGRNRIPAISMPVALEQAVMAGENAMKLLLHHRAEKKFSQLSFHQKVPPLRLLIGSEGGLSEEEVDLAQQHAYQSVKLGARVMRTETASMAAIASLQLLQGDF